MRFCMVANKIKGFAEINTRFKSEIKKRIKDQNGVAWIKYFEKNFNYEKALSSITGSMSQKDIARVLIRNMRKS